MTYAMSSRAGRMASKDVPPITSFEHGVSPRRIFEIRLLGVGIR